MARRGDDLSERGEQVEEAAGTSMDNVVDRIERSADLGREEDAVTGRPDEVEEQEDPAPDGAVEVVEDQEAG
ncbi:MAG TPA: hypothetical protein VM840_01345 [Actinomycetota bacterium]|nr:hypothetical protein [Actinomycetota bacterium]